MSTFTVSFINGVCVESVSVKADNAHDAVSVARKRTGITQSMCPRTTVTASR